MTNFVSGKNLVFVNVVKFDQYGCPESQWTNFCPPEEPSFEDYLSTQVDDIVTFGFNY